MSGYARERVQELVDEIRALVEKGDFAAADVLERVLHQEVLCEVRDGNTQVQELAVLALSTLEIEFERPFVTFASLPAKTRDQLLSTLSLPKKERDAILGRLN